jgi:hypothetical protein
LWLGGWNGRPDATTISEISPRRREGREQPVRVGSKCPRTALHQRSGCLITCSEFRGEASISLGTITWSQDPPCSSAIIPQCLGRRLVHLLAYSFSLYDPYSVLILILPSLSLAHVASSVCRRLIGEVSIPWRARWQEGLVDLRVLQLRPHRPKPPHLASSSPVLPPRCRYPEGSRLLAPLRAGASAQSNSYLGTHTRIIRPQRQCSQSWLGLVLSRKI